MNSLYLGIIFIFMSFLGIYDVIQFESIVLCAFSYAAFLASINDILKLLISDLNKFTTKAKTDEEGFFINSKGKQYKKYNVKTATKEMLNFKDLFILYCWIGNAGCIIACFLVFLATVLTIIIFCVVLKMKFILCGAILLILGCVLFVLIKNRIFIIVIDFLITFCIVFAPFASKVIVFNSDNVSQIITIWTIAVIFITIYLKEYI